MNLLKEKIVSALYFTIMFFCLEACTNPSKTIEKSNIQIIGKYKVCDTCKSTIVVSYHYCADPDCDVCEEAQIDSGILFISHYVINQIDKLKTDTSIFISGRISAADVHLDDHFLDQLWPDTNLHEHDFSEVYRITGKVTPAKLCVFDNGKKEPYLSFHVDKAVKIDTAYKKRIKYK